MTNTSHSRRPARQDDVPAEAVEKILAELRSIRSDLREVLACLSTPAHSPQPRSPVPDEPFPGRVPAISGRDQPSPASGRDQPLLTPDAPQPQGGRSQFVLWVRCLGEGLALLNGQPLTLGRSQKGQTVFRFLVASGGGPVTRDVLMELLWPGISQELARHRLNMAVYSLRRATRHPDGPPDGLILLTDGAYILSPEVELVVDANEFLACFHKAEAALAAGDEGTAAAGYQQACALYTGSYMPEERYADWTRLTRQVLEDARNTCLVKLGRLHLARQEYGEAIECVQRALAEDICREEGYRILMRCYAFTGRREQALRQFELCRQMLREELGLQPANKTLRLAEEIREGLLA